MSDFNTQKKDTFIAAVLIFIISGSIMTVANGSLFGKGVQFTHVLDMSRALEPTLGKHAVSIFFYGNIECWFIFNLSVYIDCP